MVINHKEDLTLAAVGSDHNRGLLCIGLPVPPSPPPPRKLLLATGCARCLLCFSPLAFLGAYLYQAWKSHAQRIIPPLHMLLGFLFNFS